MGRLECCWDRGMTIKCVIWLAFVRMHLNLTPSSERNSLVFSPNGVEPISMDGLDRPVCWCGWVECRGQFVLMRWLQNKSLLLWEVSFQPPPMQSRVRQILPPVSGFRYINCANQTVSFQCRTRLFRISISQQARGSCNQSPAHKLWEIRSLAQVTLCLPNPRAEFCTRWLKQHWFQTDKGLLPGCTLAELSFRSPAYTVL